MSNKDNLTPCKKLDPQMFLGSNADMCLKCGESIPSNCSGIARSYCVNEELEGGSECQEEAGFGVDDEEKDLTQLLWGENMTIFSSLNNSKHSTILSRGKRRYADLREKLNDIYEQQKKLSDGGQSKSKSVRKNSKIEKRTSISQQKHGGTSTEQTGRQTGFMGPIKQKNNNEQRGNSWLFEHRGEDRRSAGLRINQKNIRRKSLSFLKKVRKNKTNGRKQGTNNNGEGNAEQDDEPNENAITGEQNEMDSELIYKDFKRMNDMETETSEMESVMGFSCFQSSKNTSDCTDINKTSS